MQIASAKEPQKKDFVREEVRELVLEQLSKVADKKKGYRTGSLALERIVYYSENA